MAKLSNLFGRKSKLAERDKFAGRPRNGNGRDHTGRKINELEDLKNALLRPA